MYMALQIMPHLEHVVSVFCRVFLSACTEGANLRQARPESAVTDLMRCSISASRIIVFTACEVLSNF